MGRSTNVLNEQLTFYFDGNFSSEMRYFVDKFNIEFDKGNIVESLIYFSLGLRIYEFHQDERSKHELVISGTKCAVFLKDFPLIEDQLRRIIAFEMFHENYKILSAGYFMLSVIKMENEQMEESHRLAQMAFFYAQLIEGERNYFECNAKIQLISTLLLDRNIKGAEQLISTYQWYIENCETPGERLFVDCFEITILTLQDKDKHYLDMMNIILTLKKSKEIMYSTYLASFLKKICQRLNITDNRLIICTQILSYYYDETIKINKILPHMPLLNAKSFFESCQDVFQKQKEAKGKLYIYKFQMNKFEKHIITNFIEMMRIIEQNQLELYVHNYANQKFALVLLQPVESLAFFKLLHFIQINSSLEVEAEHYNNFNEIYNLLTLKLLSV